MTEQTKANEIKTDKTKSNGTKPDESKPNEVVTSATVNIPLSLVYGRLADLFQGVPQSAKVSDGTTLAITVENRQVVAK